ncbi:MAG: sensor histidine kinase [Planctomycetota bacterium]|jgi:signal transduction histidine kinase
MEEKAKTLKIDFQDEIDPDAGDFEVDPGAFRSLLTNLVENSFDACRVDRNKKSHRVSAKVWGDTDKVIFEIEDNGIGMDRETCDKAFTLFFSSKGAGGTGLGLFISNKIAQAHGGIIKLDSEEGKGTRFVVEMPRSASKRKEVDQEAGTQESSS